MASSDTDRLVKLGIGGFMLYTLYGMAATGALGTGAWKFAQQLRSAWGDTPGQLVGLTGNGSPTQAGPSTGNRTASQPAAGGLLKTRLTDWGGAPVVYNPANRTLQQDPAWFAAYPFEKGERPNVYSDGIFKGPNGETVQFAQAGAYILAQA